MNTQQSSIIRKLAGLAAIIYSSWLVGYFFNMQVAMHGTASELAVKGQPLNWLFRGGDFIAGFLVVLVAILLFRKKKSKQGLAIGMYLLFGVFTLLATKFSLVCSPIIQQCSEQLAVSRAFLHTTFGLLAGISLFTSVILVAQNRGKSGLLITYMSIAWVFLGLLSVLLGSLVDISTLQATLQRFYLIGTSLFMYLLPRLVTKTPEKS